MEVGRPQIDDAGDPGASGGDDYIHLEWHHKPASVRHGSGDYDRILEQQRTEDKAVTVYWFSVCTPL